MKKSEECPFCDGTAHLDWNKKEVHFRKEAFFVQQFYYKCNLCKAEYTTNDTDNASMLQVHNQYRAKHSIPFVEQIINIREKYGLPASKMNEVLGLGANSYTNFEKGDVPSAAIANLLLIAENPVEFKKMVLRSHDIFSSNAYHILLNKLDTLINNAAQDVRLAKIDYLNEPLSFNGYRVPNYLKTANLICLLIDKCKNDFNDRMKLNKLLFYTDFLHYKNNLSSITGLSYRAIQHGPIPSCYSNLLTYLEEENFIQSTYQKNSNGGAVEIFTVNNGFDNSVFTETELATIEHICELFKNTSSWELRNQSHEETGWLDNQLNRNLIDYQRYAFDLKLN